MNWRLSLITRVMPFFIITGCATAASDHLQPKPRPLYRELTAYQAPADSSGSAPTPAEREDPTEELSLEEALSLALTQHPDLASVSWEAKAKEGLKRQASGVPPEAD